MNIAKVTALLALADASLSLRRAELDVDQAKYIYHTAWHAFERDGDYSDYWIPDEERIVKGSPHWDEAVAATKVEYDAYQRAKRAAYNAKRRWQTACKKASEA